MSLTNDFQPSVDLLFNLGSGVGVAHDSITVHYCVPGFDHHDNTDNNVGSWDDNHDSGVNSINDEDDAGLNKLRGSARYANFHFLHKNQFCEKKYHTLTFRDNVMPANILEPLQLLQAYKNSSVSKSIL